ncbi:hypothetical protein BGZ76_006571 [Entomortierella beljakovae]|nr:hypothetical protein BGZ76_006571 [Entomortierella beljakovae]
MLLLEFVNHWFSWVGEQFSLSDKFSIGDIESNGDLYLGFIICYTDSAHISDMMMGDKESRSTHPRLGKKALSGDRYSKQTPLFFLQSHNGPCCTLALVNFLINQKCSGTVMTGLKRKVEEDLEREIDYRMRVENSDFFYTLHHVVLAQHSTGPFSEHTGNAIDAEDTNDPLVSEETDDSLVSGETDDALVTEEHDNGIEAEDDNEEIMENHMILIIPANGRVWEIDSMDDSGPLDLGPIDTNWVKRALPRLTKWDLTIEKTDIPVDIHAIMLP